MKKAEKSFQFKGLLTENGWLENVKVYLDDDGKIEKIDSGRVDSSAEGYALPGFQNAHSHAFQYAMAGLAELHSTNSVDDDFWSWRSAMYDIALSVSPDELEAIATMLYSKMLRFGYTSVAEFHYLHHDKDGKLFDNRAELGARLVSAAKTAGIKITLVPMFYQMGGFGQVALEKQKRFISPSLDEYLKLWEASEKVVRNQSHAKIGYGIHSLRAVKAGDIESFFKDYKQDLPFHIHLAEQIKEIKDCQEFYHMPPVEWFLNNAPVSENFHLVHCTHLNDFEVKGIAESGASVVLCPTTEGNLGDGIFRFIDYKEFNGNWSIGTDSHIGLNPFEELRLLDYGQRLISHKRNIFTTSESGDSGFNAIKMAWKSGRRAMGEQNSEFFEIGDDFDAVVMKSSSPLIENSSIKNLCNTFVYTADSRDILGTIVAGKWLVKENEHNKFQSIKDRFKEAIKNLAIR
ncbi:formimidoylglutamate deiminase [Aegicerativicinus sediminis]|uniref:formimidoylglutamate deiminase n=1 Tax=Aegicerativicinus sediminis TaxID=2893202 RepID=UPI001E474C6F|nr:formimidoylglutamate deiminase [Aegicerativicinus sediminis]